MLLKLIYFFYLINNGLSIDPSNIYLQHINSHKINVISTPIIYFSNNYYTSMETTICDTICKKNDIIFINGKITNAISNKFLLYVNNIISNLSNISKRLSIFIDSQGGHIHSRDIILNSINYLHHNNIKTYCYSGYQVASSATTILFSCNYRFSRKDTNFLIHHAKYEYNGKINEYEEHLLYNFNNLMLYQYFELIHFKEHIEITCSNSKYLLFQCTNSYIKMKNDFNKYIYSTEIGIKKTFDKGLLTTSNKMLEFGFIDAII
jgi:ATP-dependent protease ClpP protease subunit